MKSWEIHPHENGRGIFKHNGTIFCWNVCQWEKEIFKGFQLFFQFSQPDLLSVFIVCCVTLQKKGMEQNFIAVLFVSWYFSKL